MAAYKDGKKWRCTFYYTINGEKKKKNKRGFSTKKEALEWEREFLLKSTGDEEMLFSSLVEVYFEDMKLRYKLNTLLQREATINKWILPFFKDMKLSEITLPIIRKWQSFMLKQNLKSTSKNTVNLHFKVVLDYGKKYLNLINLPVLDSSIAKITDKTEKSIITEEQLKILLEAETNVLYRHIMITLFWTGLRIGELISLKFDDIDFDKRKLRVNKSTSRLKGKNVIGTTKTLTSNRIIDINDIVIESLLEIKDKTYDPTGNIFPVNPRSFFYHVKKLGKRCGIENIGLHTFRHSHATYLFAKGVNILLISKRLGHTNISTTLNSYTHIMQEMEWQLLEALNKK